MRRREFGRASPNKPDSPPLTLPRATLYLHALCARDTHLLHSLRSPSASHIVLLTQNRNSTHGIENDEESTGQKSRRPKND